MDYYVSYSADAGLRKKINQDCGFAEKAISKAGKLVFAVMCDGMGGLSRGEEASSIIVEAFSRWFYEKMPGYSDSDLTNALITQQWTALVRSANERVFSEGKRYGERMGSTVTALLLLHNRYFILNIGDTRAYEIDDGGVLQLTQDHTLVERQIKLGNLTREQAATSPMKSVLTRCIGVVESVEPDFFFGEAKRDAIYMLCTDGFRHVITPDEIKEGLYTSTLRDPSRLPYQERMLIDLNMKRGEKDNISVITIITRDEN